MTNFSTVKAAGSMCLMHKSHATDEHVDVVSDRLHNRE